MVSGQSKQANIHTHECNEVTLVWDSLRLAPISANFLSSLIVSCVMNTITLIPSSYTTGLALLSNCFF